VSVGPTPVLDLYRTGALNELLARTDNTSAPEDQIVRAMALTALGYAATPREANSEGQGEGRSAADILRLLARSEGESASKARTELAYARYVGAMMGVQDKDLTPDDAFPGGRSAGAGASKANTSRAHSVAALIAIRSRDFGRARTEIDVARTLASNSGDPNQIADAEFAGGKLAAWQGRADLAEEFLGRSVAHWDASGNGLLRAHAQYELGVMYSDRRDWVIATTLLSAVVDEYHARGAAPGYMDRARQALGASLVGAGRLDEAESMLEPLRGAADDYRFAMVHRDLSRLKLKRALGGEERSRQLADAWKDWTTAHDRVSGWDAASFPVLTLRQLEAELRLADTRNQTAEALTLAGDMLARVAEAFSAKLSERPHEIGARISAIEAYTAAASAPDVQDRASLVAAAGNEAERLNTAAASIAFRLDDRTVALVDAARRLGGRLASVGSSEESLLTFMRRDIPDADRLEILARLAEAMARVHELGVAPCGFGPGDVVVRHPANPAIREIPGPDALHRPERAGDRPFMAPELISGRAGDARSDLYLLGALMITWFGEAPPSNEGGLLLWLRRALRGRPLKTRGPALSGLALELTVLNWRNRPPNGYEAADRFRQAARSLTTPEPR
jgi:hypothetical protein